MSGKYDPDKHRGKSHQKRERQPTLRELYGKPFITDAEWYQSPMYKRLSKSGSKANHKKGEL